MIEKRRWLKEGEEIVLLYDTELGFIQQSATFKEYRDINYEGIKHKIPVFVRNGSEITGLACFWIRLEDIIDDLDIERIQRELIDLQLKVFEIGSAKNYKVPEKIADKEIRQMASVNAEYRAKLVQKIGYDPLDHSWVEKELASSPLEHDWFEFQRKKHGSFDDQWERHIEEFKLAYHKDVTIHEAFNLSRKWKRFVVGAYNTIASRNSNMEDWKTAGRKFEEHHRAVEDRMMVWSVKQSDRYPLAKVKKPIQFRHGPYFNECIERVPKLFTDSTCYYVRPDVVLRVVSYDPKLKYIRLDFTADICEIIKPGVPPNQPWEPLRSDYVIYVPPDEVDTHLEFIDPVD